MDSVSSLYHLLVWGVPTPGGKVQPVWTKSQLFPKTRGGGLSLVWNNVQDNTPKSVTLPGLCKLWWLLFVCTQPRSNQHQNYGSQTRVELHVYKIYILPFPRITNDKNLSCLTQLFLDTVIFAWNKYKLQWIITGGIVLSFSNLQIEKMSNTI